MGSRFQLGVVAVSTLAVAGCAGSAQVPADAGSGKVTVTVTSSDQASSSPTLDTAEPASGDRPFQAVYEVHLDPDRTLLVELNGQFEAREDKANAKAGETEIFVRTTGSAKVTNTSDGRNTDAFSHGFELFLPVDSCPNWLTGTDGEVGPYCAYGLFKVNAPRLSPGDPHTVYLDKTERVDSVKVADAPRVLKAIMGKEGVLVSADRLYVNEDLAKYNATCDMGDGVKWVTYFSESDTVDACSTETAAT